MGKIKSFIAGFTVGSLAAGAAILLSTPKSGAERRREIKETGMWAKQAIGQIKTDSMALKNDIVTVSKQAVPTIKEGARGFKTSIDEWKRDIEPNIESLQNKIQALNDELDKLEEDTNNQPPK